MTPEDIINLQLGIPPGTTIEQAGPAAGVALFVFLCIAVVCTIRSHDRPE